MPLEFHLVKGNEHEAKQVDVLLDLLEVAPRVVLMDKGFTGDKIAKCVRKIGAIPVVPRKQNSKAERRYFPSKLYKARTRVEHFFCRIKKFRRIETRYDKLASNFMGFIFFTAGIIWIKQILK
jgi:putative transposase